LKQRYTLTSVKTLLFCLFLGISRLAFGQTLGTGLLFDDEAYEKVPLKARNVGFMDPAAGIHSASLKTYVPEVKNQGIYGTCVGWSSAYYGRTILYARMNNITDKALITKQAFSPSFTYLQANVPNDANCMNGAYVDKALKSMVDDGTAPLLEFASECNDHIPENVIHSAKDNRIKDFSRLFSKTESKVIKIESVKRALINKNPVIAGFQAEKALFRAKEVYEPDHQGILGGHAMCVIGFDDAKYGGAFEVVNSWGKTWGNDGYMWFRYDDFVNYVSYAYEMIPNISAKKTRHMAGKLILNVENGEEMAVISGAGDYKRSVLGWQQVVVEDSVQSIGDYHTDKPYAEGTRYRMQVEVEKPSYVYVFGADSENHNGVLFPHKPSISAYIAYENTKVIIPGENYWFKLNGDIDSDYSIVIFSENKIDTDTVLNQLNTLEGNLMDKLYLIFKDRLISKENVQLSKKSMGFSASYGQGSMVMLLVDIKRR